MSENVHPLADALDSLSTLELLELMQAEDRRAVDAIRSELNQVARAVDSIAERVGAGGRLHYFGAGTSGRIAVVDASECPATFGVAADAVQAHAAGDGEHEDDENLGREHAAGVTARDAVVGLSASGGTRYVLAALEAARSAGALAVAITCNRASELASRADIAIEVETGAEVIAGSTRLKAGTVQKAVLNMISTGVFVRLGHTFRGRMIDMVPSNRKLRGRSEAVVADLAGVSRAEADQALGSAAGNARVAVVMLERRVDARTARQLLEDAGGDLALVLAGARRS